MPLLLIPLLFMGGERETEDVAAVVPSVTIEALGTQLPLHVNARVERWMKRFQTTERATFETLLKQRSVYDELVRGKLRERGMPEELLYLAMMESGLKPRAVSRVSAVGLWQFMSPTALQYGLRVDEWVDERRDPVRATDAALDYLQWLHGRFGSWYLTAAAYNAGPGRVERVLRRHAEGRTGDEDIYWEVLDHLPRETREYVPRLVAATILGEEAEAYGFVVEFADPYRFDRVFVPGGTTLVRVAAGLGVDERLLRDLNPHLVRGVTPPGEMYGVRVPVGDARRVVALLNRGLRTRRAD
ncbi:MAG: lytic transglycosylase domain-containing protein [Gemmatimonadetes bacterium]|nr:lytic transglycosylase domain-containing protein [Gemmatimonadota bacterium]